MASHDHHHLYPQLPRGIAIKLAASSLLGLLLMGGTAQPGEQANRIGGDRSQLGGSSWALVSMEQNGRTIQPHPEGERITLIIDAESRHINGNSGCNAYGGNARLTGETAIFTAIQAGMRACSQPVMAVERLFLDSLTQATHWERRESDRLKISSRDNQFVLNFAPLF